ncbi:MAG TPA: prepilin-type N-terminal cleavage/methylation domain-containing protein [Planctomycetota bacterium]|nr:prepilin-type N-terminal cleavage/methylation domain-containing protein [Planctomycetota bacterium]
MGRGQRGFTLIEMLMVIGIIILVMALALPNFLAMMRDRQWLSAIGDLQTMVWRARALATNLRADMAVEFDIRPDGTTMWVESECNQIEQLPDLAGLVAEIQQSSPQGGTMWYFLTTTWVASGGVYANPNSFNPANTQALFIGWQGEHYYGDNAKQSEEVALQAGITIDASAQWSPNFTNWDSSTTARYYGSDGTYDIRISPHGALMQSRDPVVCLKQVDEENRRQVQVIRCTGRVLDVR